MSYKDEIKELLKKLAERMQDPDLEWLDTNYSLKDNIDQNFSLEDAAGNVLEYWNESVKKLLEKLKDELDNPWGTGENINKNVSKEHDAAFDFNKQYVSPNPNLNSEKYEDNRTDEIISVLQNKKNLDYTIGEISSELKKYVTRLIMPQYQRRVEIEDLNRNFWVIGQNLSLLNKFILDLDGPILGAIKDLISEITGLWDNVYRIWQAILHLSKKTDDLNDDINDLASVAAKTRVKLAYSISFSQDEFPFDNEELLKRLYKYNGDELALSSNGKLQLTNYFTFKKDDVKYFGILPAIEKEKIKYKNENNNIESGWLAYLSYNRAIGIDDLNEVSEEELEEQFLDGKSRGGLIQIERKFGNRPVKEILEDLRTKNFVLLAPLLKGEIKAIDELDITYEPYLTFLQFIRDILFYNVEEIVERLTKVTTESTTSLASLRIAYLNWLIFTKSTRWSLQDYVPENFVSAYKYINKIKPELVQDTIFSEKNLPINDDTLISTLLTTIRGAFGTAKFLEDFYKVYKNIAVEIGIQPEEITEDDFPYFVTNKNTYTIIENDITGLSKFLEKAEKWSKENSYDGKGSISFCPTYLLFSGKDNYFNDDINVEKIVINDVGYKIEMPSSGLVSIPTISWDLTCNEFISANFDKFANFSSDLQGTPEQTLSSQHYVTYIDNGYLPSYNNGIKDPLVRLEDSLEVVLPNSGHFIENESGVFGCSNLYVKKPVFGLWFDFIQRGSGVGAVALTGQLSSLTARLFNGTGYQNHEYNISSTSSDMVWHNIYNVDIQAHFAGNENRKYWDFIRYGKPYPSIAALLHYKKVGNYDHITQLNNVDNIIHYSDPLRSEGKIDENGQLIKPYNERCDAIDGFIGFATGKNYPIEFSNPSIEPAKYTFSTKKFNNGDTPIDGLPALEHDVYCGDFIRERIDSNKKEIYYYGPIFNGEKTYTICSTDLINAYKDSGAPTGSNWTSDIHEGYTMWENTNRKENPAITISYLLSDTEDQQLSIFISKDTTTKDWTIAPSPIEINIEGILLNYDEFDPNNLWGIRETAVPDPMTSESWNYGIDCFANGTNFNDIYKKVGDDLSVDAELNESQSNIIKYNFYRQKLNLTQPVTYGVRLKNMPNENFPAESNDDVEYEELLSVVNAQKMVKQYMDKQETKDTTYFIITRTIYNHWSSQERNIQTAGIYLGYIAIWSQGTIRLTPINRILTPGAVCNECQTKLGLQNNLKKLIFIEKDGHDYGHIHRFNKNNGEKSSWGMAVYAEINTISNIDNKLTATLYFPDIANYKGQIQQANSFVELKNRFNLDKIKEKGNEKYIYAKIEISGTADIVDEDNVNLSKPELRLKWHEGEYPWENRPMN